MKNYLYPYLVLLLCFFTTGCYESRIEVQVRKDGSGSLKGSLLISEQMMMAIETSEQSDSSTRTNVSVPFHEKSFVEKLGEDVEVIELTTTDLEDGARELKFQVEVPDIIAFLNQGKKGDGIGSFRIVRNREGQGELVFESQVSESPMSPELGQLYGVMKGFYLKLTVDMPVKLSSEVANLSRDGSRVVWEFDLRDREGLKRAVAAAESMGKDQGFASFSLDQWPEVADRLTVSSPGPAEGVASTNIENDGRLWAQVASLQLTRNHQLLSEEEMEGVRFHSGNKEELKIHVMVSWAEESKPSEYGQLVLEEVLTETGESLLEDVNRPRFSSDVHDRMTSILSWATVKAPSPVSTTLRLVKGYVPVVAGTETQKILIENPLDLPVNHVFEEEALERVGAVLEEVSEKNVKIGVSGKAIDELVLVKADGTRENPGTSRSSRNNQNTYTFHFGEPIQPGDSIEITVRLSETKVNVPFEARDLRLP